MAQQKLTMAAYVRHRAREHMRNFNTPRAKAVRYAAEAWVAMRGDQRRTTPASDFKRFLERTVGPAR